jgi:hypothetical protein
MLVLLGSSADYSRKRGLTSNYAAWQHATITNHGEFSKRKSPEMMRNHYITQPIQRPALGTCFMQATERLVVKDWSFSGRTTE